MTTTYKDTHKKEIYTSEEQIRSQLLALEQQLFRMESGKYHQEGYQSSIIRNVDSLCGEDSLDSLNPYIQYFIIDGDTDKLISVQSHFRILPFRAYAKAAASGGGTTGEQNTVTTTGQSSITTTPSGGGSTTPSGGGTTTPSGGGHTSSSGSAYLQLITRNLSIDSGGHVTGFETVWCATHDHTHSVYNHVHSCPNHVHATPDHVHNIAHTHEFVHTHAIIAHTHEITFGIYEKTPTSPTIDVYLSNNSYDFDIYLGTFTTDNVVEFASRIKGTGWKALKFEANELMRIQSMIRIKSDITVTE